MATGALDESGCLSPDLLLDWAERRVSPREVERIELHVAECSTCRRLLADAVLSGGPPQPDAPRAMTSFGRYQLREEIGRGGMGEVHRAFDPSLGRDVALKILRETGADPDAHRRFEREARAAAMVSHPNVVAIFDFGFEGELPFLVTELMEGRSLEDRLSEGRPPISESLEIAIQVARGLVAAHDKSVIHRDLKPANLFLTKAGICKILDFGLAKQIRAPMPDGDTDSDLTHPGAIIGTLSYMAPEQARGEAADHRSDIFALGAILFELLTGKRAFKRKSGVETLHAILTEEPFAQNELPAIPVPLERILRRALAKEPADRFQSTRDLLFALETTASMSAELSDLTKLLPSRPAKPKRARAWWAAALAIAAGAFAIGTVLATKPAPLPAYERVIFRAGTLYGARFAPEGHEIIVSGVFGEGMELLAARAGSPEMRPLDQRAGLLAVSRDGQLAIGTAPNIFQSWFSGTVAVVPMAGGAPRSIAENAQSADFDPEGTLAISRIEVVRSTVEYPPGHVIFDQPGWISGVRFSSRGDLAFVHHPYLSLDTGQIMRLDRGGELRSVGPRWHNIRGLAWPPDGGEIWFTATQHGFNNELHAMSPSGDVRKLLTAPARLVLHDIARDGALLLSREDLDSRIIVGGPTIGEERDLGWLDDAMPVDFDADGRSLFTMEWGEAVGDDYVLYQRAIDGSPAVRLGRGRFARLSPDGREMMTLPAQPPFLPVRMPLGPGVPQPLDPGKLEQVVALSWCPDGTCIVFLGNEPGNPLRLYRQRLDGAPELLGECPLTVIGFEMSPDGSAALGTDDHARLAVFHLEGAQRLQIIPGADGTLPVGWSSDSRAVHFLRRGSDRSTVERYDLESGSTEVLFTLRPAQPSGFFAIDLARLSRDARLVAYRSRGWSSRLYVVRGIE